jgi:regulatory protein
MIGAGPGSAGRGRRRQRPIDSARLERIALAYVDRYGGSTAALRRVLTRRVERAAAAGLADPEALAPVIESLVAKLAEAGLVDDRAFAEGRARALARRGASRRRIAADLGRRGLDSDMVAAGLDRVAAEAPGDDYDLAAALRHARRRGIGPFRAEEARAAARSRDAAALARAGFPARVVRLVIEARDPADLEARAAEGS